MSSRRGAAGKASKAEVAVEPPIATLERTRQSWISPSLEGPENNKRTAEQQHEKRKQGVSPALRRTWAGWGR